MEEEEKNKDSYTVMRNKKRRRDSGTPNTTTAQTNSAGTSGNTSAAPRMPGSWSPRVQEVKATRAQIAEARARQATPTHEQSVYIEHCPDFSPHQYLQAVNKVVGGAKHIIQLTRMNGHVLVGLITKAPAERLIDAGLEIEGTILRTFPFRIRTNCPMLARQTTGPRQALPSSPTNAKSPAASQQPRQPAPPSPSVEVQIKAPAVPHSTAPQPAQPAIVAPPPPLPAPRTLELETAPITIEMMDVENREKENTGSSTSSQRSVISHELDNFLEKASSSLYAETDQLGLQREEVLRALASESGLDNLMPRLKAAQKAALTRLTDVILEKRPGSSSTIAVVTPPAAISDSGLACVFGPGVAVLRQRVLWPGHVALAVIDVHGEEMTFINVYLTHDSHERLEQLELMAAAAIQKGAWAFTVLLDLATLVDVATQFDAAHLPTRVASHGDVSRRVAPAKRLGEMDGHQDRAARRGQISLKGARVHLPQSPQTPPASPGARRTPSPRGPPPGTSPGHRRRRGGYCWGLAVGRRLRRPPVRLRLPGSRLPAIPPGVPAPPTGHRGLDTSALRRGGRDDTGWRVQNRRYQSPEWRETGLRCERGALQHRAGPLLRRLESILGVGNVIAYADDIVLLVHRDEQFARVAAVFEDFHRASGITVNYGKSAGLWCGAMRERGDSPLGASWSSSSVKVLGIRIASRSSVAQREQHLLALLESACRKWTPFMRGLSLVKRARAANSLALSTIQHHLHAYLPEAATISRLQARVTSFIWRLDHTAWLPGGILARPMVTEGIGLIDIRTQLHLACLKGVQVALRVVKYGFFWLATSDSWLRPPPDGTRIQPLRLRRLRMWESVTKTLSLNHQVVRTNQLKDLPIIGGCRFLRPLNLLAPARWITTRSARRALERPRFSALPITRLLVKWEPIVDVPIKVNWSSIRSGAFTGHNRDIAHRLALHALPHPDHPAFAGPSCPTCGSSDGSLGHRYWGCHKIRPHVREAFNIVGSPLISRHGSSRITKWPSFPEIYRHFVQRLTPGFHRRVKAKTSLQDDDVPIDDTTTKPLFTPQEKGCKGIRNKLPTLRWNPWQKHVRSIWQYNEYGHNIIHQKYRNGKNGASVNALDRRSNTKKEYPTGAITNKTLRIYEKIVEQVPSSSSTEKKPNILASHGWFERFKIRHSLHSLKLKGELASGDVDAAQEYLSNFAEIINDNSYTSDQVFNADESGLFWKKMPERTYVSKFYKSASGHKAAKDRITILFCSNASGDYIMKPLVINKSKMPRAFKGVNINNLPVYWRANKEAWVTAAMFTEWFHECFIPDDKKYLSSKGLPFKVLLLIDNAPGHPRDLEYENVEIVQMAHSLGGEGFDDFTDGDIAALMTDKELSEDDLVNLVCESESEKSDEEELVPVTFTAKVIREVLALGRKLGNHFMQNDTNVERALRFQRDINRCLAQYEEVYKDLTKNSKQLLITDFITIFS
ncbi:TIGD1 [Cordylochernes scorpioides]|uniref:TIGD1 n=1 Tax=Cordylochernes scorpioides TaxID=51811 RepID=A0ABY6KI96_9ARAC|nr:TIGD1 [Cordylochernes scorpioides]